MTKRDLKMVIKRLEKGGSPIRTFNTLWAEFTRLNNVISGYKEKYGELKFTDGEVEEKIEERTL